MAYQKWTQKQIAELRALSRSFIESGSQEYFSASEWLRMKDGESSPFSTGNDIRLGQMASRLSIWLRVPSIEKSYDCGGSDFVGTRKAYQRRILEAITGAVHVES